MAIEPAEIGVKQAQQTVFVDTFTNGLTGTGGPHARAGRERWPHRLEPDPRMLGPDDHPLDSRRPRG